MKKHQSPRPVFNRLGIRILPSNKRPIEKIAQHIARVGKLVEDAISHDNVISGGCREH